MGLIVALSAGAVCLALYTIYVQLEGMAKALRNMDKSLRLIAQRSK